MADDLEKMENLQLKPRIVYGAWIEAQDGRKTLITQMPHDAFVGYLKSQLQLNGGDVEKAMIEPRAQVQNLIARGGK